MTLVHGNTSTPLHHDDFMAAESAYHKTYYASWICSMYRFLWSCIP